MTERKSVSQYAALDSSMFYILPSFKLGRKEEDEGGREEGRRQGKKGDKERKKKGTKETIREESKDGSR